MITSHVIKYNIFDFLFFIFVEYRLKMIWYIKFI